METANPEPKPSLQNTLGSLAESYAKHQAGENIDTRQVAQDLTNLYQTLGPGYKKDPNLAIIFKECGPLATDPGTGQNLIHDPKILDLIYPQRHKKPGHSIKTKLALTAAALGTAAVGTAGALMATGPDVSDYIYRGAPKASPAGLTKDHGLVITLPSETTTPEPEIPTTPVATPIPPTESATPTAKIPLPTTTQSATSTATSTAIPTETPLPTASPFPTVSPEETAKKEFGDINMAEYFLGDLCRILKDRRLEKAQNDPAYAERVDSEFLNSDSINILYLGIDDTRERWREANDQGWGRSDITMLVTFNPKTFQVNAVSFPRDMFAPELTPFKFSGGARINAATMAPYVDPSIDSFELVSKIIESATGIPVDFTVKTNVDFMQGYPRDEKFYSPGFFDTVFPNGLPVVVPYEIRDNEYPTKNYGSKKLVITKGEHVMDGRELTEFGRSRHETSDFDRSDRQRLILYAAIKQLVPDLIKDFMGGKTDTIDRLISALGQQDEYTNLSSDLDITEAAKTIKQGVEQLWQDPKGIATLALLAANSLQDTAFNSLGLTRANGLVTNVGANEPFYWDYMLKVNGSSTASKPTKLNNYLTYWDPIRRYIKDQLH